MKASLLFVAAPAVQAAVSYMAAVPESLMAKVESSDCTLPDDFQIQNFAAESPDGGQTVESLNFNFNDDSAILSTPCQLNASSVPVTSDGRTPRYACDDARVQFIWQNGTITVIEKVCPGDDGAADYEASGTAVVPVVCDGAAGNGTGNAARQRRRNSRRAVACKSNSDDIRSRFFSIQPVPGGGEA
ncbi:uncharacterized protein ColSpa_02055 [Colletotrichum spaethianum]|uniref:AA1-like domain-containing protein n=1 Tax=Colletotrichum spaethianum TaxID=700344 RepID=A0AA37L761_9PEZI|nr:uncharacterized protein ColSpa_02055 [Colletotrichum spaethianum]GKT41874.1 hypothetical protein ColSpa_02055 [Colletotrichum spaethianum]